MTLSRSETASSVQHACCLHQRNFQIRTICCLNEHGTLKLKKLISNQHGFPISENLLSKSTWHSKFGKSAVQIIATFRIRKIRGLNQHGSAHSERPSSWTNTTLRMRKICCLNQRDFLISENLWSILTWLSKFRKNVI